jgi:hypothetical protein
MTRILKEDRFSIYTTVNGKIYVDVFQKSDFYFAVCNFLALKLPNWPPTAEIRLSQHAQTKPNKK